MNLDGAYNCAPDSVKKFVDNVIKIEGGYVNNKHDSGGETKYGITKAVARAHGFSGKMEDLSLGFAQDIYVYDYWIEPKLYLIADVSHLIAEEVFDTGVNSGTKIAVKILQRSLNGLNNKQKYYPDISVDGVMGQNTKKALSSFLKSRGDKGETVLFNLLNILQGAFLFGLSERREKDEEFLYGWLSHRTIFIEK